MSDETDQPVALEGSTELQPAPKAEDNDVESKQDDTGAKTEGEGKPDGDGSQPDGGGEQETKEGDEGAPPPKDEVGEEETKDETDVDDPSPDLEVTPEPDAKGEDEEEEETKDDAVEETKGDDDVSAAQPKITYVDPKPWMTPKMAEERPVPSASQVSAVLAVQKGWRENPAPKPEMRFFEYGDNMPKGVNPTEEQVEQLTRAIRDS